MAMAIYHAVVVVAVRYCLVAPNGADGAALATVRLP